MTPAGKAAMFVQQWTKSDRLTQWTWQAIAWPLFWFAAARLALYLSARILVRNPEFVLLMAVTTLWLMARLR